MNFIQRAVGATACAVFLALTAPATALAQIPVTDVASLTQQIQQVMSWMQQYQQMIDQLNNQKEQIQNQVKQIEQLKGGRGMAQLAANMTRQSLPEDFVRQVDQLRQMGSAGSTAGAQAIYAAVRTFDCSQRFVANPTAVKSCDTSTMITPTKIDLINKSIDSAKRRQQELSAFVNSVDTSDAKAAADLNNRISAEGAYLQNEQMQMNMALAFLDEQRRLTEQQQKEEGVRKLNRASGGGSNPFNLN